MKKLNLLTPIFALTASTAIVLPIASCSCSTEVTIPVEALNIDGNTLKGLREGVDISKCTTLKIPSTIETIDTGCFKSAFTSLNKVSKVIIPGSVKTIKANAFELCYGISEFDFSGFSRDEINAITIENSAFGALENYVWYANIKFNQSWADELPATNKFKAKLEDAGVPQYWFVQTTDGHVEYDNVTDQICTLGGGFVRLHLLEDYDPTNMYIPVVTKVDGMSGITVKSDDIATHKEKNIISFNTEMIYRTESQKKEGDWVSYKVTLFCSKGSQIKWVQNVQIYTSHFKTANFVHVDNIFFETPKQEVKVNDVWTPKIKFNPSNVTDTSYKLTSADESIVKVEGNKLIAQKAGEVEITVTSSDNAQKTDKCKVIVK